MSITTVCPQGTDHPGDCEVWNDSKLWDPSLFKEEEAKIIFRPGEYRAHQRIAVGNHVTITGQVEIPLPSDRLKQVVRDPSKQAVFICLPKEPNPNKKGGVETAGFRFEKSVGSSVSDLYLLGYQGVDFLGATNTSARQVVVQHYVGDWPNGYYCWFQQTGAFFVHGGSTGTKLLNCSGVSQHHTFLNHDGGWIRNSLWEGCRSFYAGCGKEPSNLSKPAEYGTGRADWTVGGDGGEECDIDGFIARWCTFYGAGKVGLYWEPESTGLATRGKVFIRKNITVEDCLFGRNGRYGGGVNGSPMLCKESESCGLFMGSGTARRNYAWDNGKANYYARQEFNVDPLVYEHNVSVGSMIGFALELAGAKATYRNNIVKTPLKFGFKLMGSGPVVGIDNAVEVSGEVEAYHLGGYTRIYLQDSWDKGHQALVKKTSAETFWGMPKLSLSGTVKNSGGPLYIVHPGTSVQTSGITLTRSNKVLEIVPPFTLDEVPVVDTPEVPPVVLPPDNEQGYLIPTDYCVWVVTPDRGPHQLQTPFLDDQDRRWFTNGRKYTPEVE